ncbi:hypothetical protein [Streptomyces qinglanensis]|uniref:hypothetical protein n=1 Tax=Streptomyces qinglanensis TaxID=943816 RepID=UPI003D7113B9
MTTDTCRTFAVLDNLTGRPVRDRMGGCEAQWLCRSLNLDSGPGARFALGVVENGALQRLTIEEYVNDDGALVRW